MQNITYEEVKNAISLLTGGKSCGLDGVHAEHFKFTSSRLSVLLALCFNAFINHGYLPSSFMVSILSPVVKDKNEDLSSSKNYRPIALSTTASKTLELCLLHRYESYLYNTDNQFGYKKKLGTELCLYTLKEIVDFYYERQTPVHICFIDASKAFDRINYHKLFIKLLKETDIASIIVRFLMYWYSNQTMSIRWDNYVSDFFSIGNGVRQGSVLSSKLFNFYYYNLSILLSETGIGCHINNKAINHLIYADDLCILATTVSALQSLVNIFIQYAQDHDIIINTGKTKVMTVKPPELYNIDFGKICIKETTLKRTTKEKYLGFMFTADNRDDSDMINQKCKMYARINKLISVFQFCSQKVKIKLFCSFITSVYGLSMWRNYYNYNKRNIIAAYNKGMAKFFNVSFPYTASAICVQTNVPHFKVLERKCMYSLSNRISTSENAILNSLINSDVYLTSCMWNRWRNNLF